MTFEICYLIAGDVVWSPVLFVCALAQFFLVSHFCPNWPEFVIPHRRRTGKPLEKEFLHAGFFGWFRDTARSISYLRLVHSAHMVVFPPLLASVLLLFQAMPLAVFGIVHVTFLGFVQSADVHRFAIPLHSVVLLTGFNFFVTERSSRFVFLCAIPVALALDFRYAGNQISSRQFGDGVWAQVPAVKEMLHLG
jgi:hypothetical protein